MKISGPYQQKKGYVGLKEGEQEIQKVSFKSGIKMLYEQLKITVKQEKHQAPKKP